MPGAKVTITQTETNFQSVTETNSEGIYRVGSLRPGPYRITVEAAGFKSFIRENAVLRTGDTMAINATLEVGAVSESIEVTAAVPLLETETSATGQVVSGDYQYALPLYQRNVKAIMYLVPGMTMNGFGYAGQMNNFHINGLRSGYIGYFEDGALATGTDNNGLTSDTILNAVEEVKVITSALPAEYGHSAGGAITVVKKTGTNEFHGMLSMLGRTRRMQHRKYFDRETPTQRGDMIVFAQPDANISGPVYIPKIYDGRNRTFFMLAWQKLIDKQAKQNQYTVPTEEMKQGDFRFGGIGQPIYDPRTTRQLSDGTWVRDPFPDNIIPKSQFDPVAAKILSYDPFTHPNQPGSMSTTGPTQNLALAPVTAVLWPNWSIRTDHQFSPSLKSYFSYTWNERDYWTKPTTIKYLPFSSSEAREPIHMHTVSLGTTWVLSPTLVSETRAGYYRRRQGWEVPTYMKNMAAEIGLPNLAPDHFPLGFYGSLGQGTPTVDVNETLSFKQDVSKVSGSHAFKWGYELMRYRINSYSIGDPSGNFSFTSTAGLRPNGTNLPNTGNDFASFLVGSISSVTFTQTLNSNLPRSWQHSFYFQDDWKIHPTLTLNLGLRYSVETPPTQKYGFISIWDPNAIDDNQYTGWSCPPEGCRGAWTHPKGAKPYNTDWNNYQPRIGLAWHPYQKFVVRSGFALSHVDMKLGFLYTDELMSRSVTQSRPTGDPRPLFQLKEGPAPVVYPALRPDGSLPYVGNPGGHSANIVDRNLQAAYTMNWNFGIQYELSRDYLLEVQYNGSRQVGNSGSLQFNTLPWGYLADDPVARDAWIPVAQYSRPFPNWGNLYYQGNYGQLSHHSGTVKIEKRFSKGLNFLAFYTFGKTIDENVSNIYLERKLNRGRADWDQTHRFSGSMMYEIPIGKGRRFLNRGGWLNMLIGGFDFVWTYSIYSGEPLGIGISGMDTQNYPSWMPQTTSAVLLRRPRLRENWQDLGPDRWTRQYQNSLIDCGPATPFGNDCVTYAPSYERGNAGRNIWSKQRVIAANLSASKEVPIKERARVQFRFDFQNPFKWYNFAEPSTTLNLRNPHYFGKVTWDAISAHYGGQPLMNLTLAVKW